MSYLPWTAPDPLNGTAKILATYILEIQHNVNHLQETAGLGITQFSPAVGATTKFLKNLVEELKTAAGDSKLLGYYGYSSVTDVLGHPWSAYPKSVKDRIECWGYAILNDLRKIIDNTTDLLLTTSTYVVYNYGAGGIETSKVEKLLTSDFSLTSGITWNNGPLIYIVNAYITSYGLFLYIQQEDQGQDGFPSKLQKRKKSDLSIVAERTGLDNVYNQLKADISALYALHETADDYEIEKLSKATLGTVGGSGNLGDSSTPSGTGKFKVYGFSGFTLDKDFIYACGVAKDGSNNDVAKIVKMTKSFGLVEEHIRTDLTAFTYIGVDENFLYVTSGSIGTVLKKLNKADYTESVSVSCNQTVRGITANGTNIYLVERTVLENRVAERLASDLSITKYYTFNNSITANGDVTVDGWYGLVNES